MNKLPSYLLYLTHDSIVDELSPRAVLTEKSFRKRTSSKASTALRCQMARNRMSWAGMRAARFHQPPCSMVLTTQNVWRAEPRGRPQGLALKVPPHHRESPVSEFSQPGVSPAPSLLFQASSVSQCLALPSTCQENKELIVISVTFFLRIFLGCFSRRDVLKFTLTIFLFFNNYKTF